MAKRVLKFGGSSVATPERIRVVAERIARERRAGNELVVVVSAMGDTTDDLLALACEISPDPRRRHPRELDMLLSAGERISMALLAMAIRECGIEAISFTGSQAAILTDAVHTGARIREVRADRVREQLDKGRVVIVAGFQGVSPEREVTTLGRGGSDTTAVALAVALGAEECHIYTDVDGVYTADPRQVANARRIDFLDYDEMLELAVSGARVMHPRAVEIAARHDIPIRVLSSFREDGDRGTLIARKERGMIEEMALTGLATESGYARLILCGLPTGMEAMTKVMSRLAASGISVDMVSPADRPDGRRQLQLSIREDVMEEACAECRALVEALGGEELVVHSGLARLVLVGSGMTGRPGVYARALEALHAAGIEVHALSTSSISIALLVDEEHEARAAALLHDAFQLGEA